MPRFLPSLLSALLVAAFAGLMMRDISRISAEPETEFTGPGEFTFTAPVADLFTIWHKSTASIDGIYSVREKRLPAGTNIMVTHAGVVVPAKVDGTNSVSGGETGDKTSVLTFRASAQGDYRITITGLPEEHAFSITRGQGLMAIFRVMGWATATAFAGALFVLFLILALARTFPKPRAAPHPLQPAS